MEIYLTAHQIGAMETDGTNTVSIIKAGCLI